jgi:glycosyltransferase involved in cell wall biosynthesis
VDLSRFRQARPREEVRRGLGLPPEARVVGLVARLDHWGKGHRELFAALAQLQESLPVQALIVGGGRRQGDMEKLAASLGIGGAVHFLGNRRDVPDLLGAMDIFVLPSHSEGVSLALLEAMAAGLPVIASAVGGLPEVIADGVNGLLIPPRDPGALAGALARLLAEPDLARRLGGQARRDVENYYSVERLVREVNGIYEDLLKKKGLVVRD